MIIAHRESETQDGRGICRHTVSTGRSRFLSPKALSRAPCGFKYKLQVRLKLPVTWVSLPVALTWKRCIRVLWREGPEDALTGGTSADATYTRCASELTRQHLSNVIFLQHIFKGRRGVRKPRFGY